MSEAEWEQRIKADFEAHPGSWRADHHNWYREGWLAGYNHAKPALDLMRSLSINPAIPHGFRSLMKSVLDRE